MEESTLYRKQSMERIQSPEQLNDYLHVTNPTVWVVLAAVVLLLAGLLVWSTSAGLDSYASGIAQVSDGTMVVVFDDTSLAANVEAGMTVAVGETSSTVTSVGIDANGSVFALADTALADGVYSARVVYRQIRVLKLLFN